MEPLENLLIEAIAEPETFEFVPSERLGKALKGRAFKVRAMTNAEYRSFMKLAYISRNGKREFDNIRFVESIVLNCTIEPNFRKADAIEKAGCGTPEEFMHKVLLPGEIDRLGNEIARRSGFGAQDIEEAYEDTKKP